MNAKSFISGLPVILSVVVKDIAIFPWYLLKTLLFPSSQVKSRALKVAPKIRTRFVIVKQVKKICSKAGVSNSKGLAFVLKMNLFGKITHCYLWNLHFSYVRGPHKHSRGPRVWDPCSKAIWFPRWKEKPIVIW